MFDHIKEKFEERNFDVPLGHTGYFEGDKLTRNNIPAWRNLPREVWTEDKHGRFVAVTAAKLFAHNSYVGNAPVIIWERYTGDIFPLMIWLPIAGNDFSIPSSKAEQVLRALAGEEKVTFPDGIGGVPMTFEPSPPEGYEREGSAEKKEDGGFRLHNGSYEFVHFAGAIEERIVSSQFDVEEERVIESVEISRPEERFALPTVTATFRSGETEKLFDFLPDEISFEEEELVGLTEDEAHQLRRKKDESYLAS